MSIDTFLLSADTTDLDYPEVRPTLDLNFARVKALDPRITFTRASGGSYVGADGLIKLAGVNEARFDHDPVTGESLGLLIEESRSNLITYSEEFNDASWIKDGASITTNNIVAPDGTLTADKLVENTANVGHFTYKNRTGSNETVTFSVFAKAGERTILAMQLSNFLTEAIQVNFNLLLGTKSTILGSGSDYTNSSASIIPYPNGWYRCIITSTKGSAVNTVNNPALSPNNNFTGTSVYTGDGTSGLFLWGAQLETGAFPTSYIPTVASTRTRAADNASITGKNFSDFYRQDEGTFLALLKNIKQQPSTGSYVRIIDIRGTPIFENYFAIVIIPNTLAIYGEMKTNNKSQLDFAATYPSATNDVKIVVSLQQNNFMSYNNGIIFLKDNLITLPIFNKLSICSDGSTSQTNGTISRFTYFPKRLTNAQLQALTR
jgi:hypothetical protein